MATLNLRIGRLKVGSVPGMRNKVALALLIYKPVYWPEKLFTLKIFEIYYSMYTEGKGGKKLKLFDPLLTYWKTQFSWNNPQVCSFPFLSWLLKWSSITL